MPGSRTFFYLHKMVASIRRWSAVVRWTLLGTLGCMVISVIFNCVAFADLGDEALNRSIMSAVALPVILGVPLFSFMSLRLRGMAISNVRLDKIARTDGLTSCLNRTAFTAEVAHRLQNLDRSGRGGALLMIDADNFKTVNDSFGHDQGDEALTIISRIIRQVVRPGDLVGRMGGEEFAVFLPGANHRTVAVIAERIRLAVYLAHFAPDGHRCPLSVSIGGAVFETTAGFPNLFRVADRCLYAAKSAGRNRVEIIKEPTPPPIAMDDRRIA